MPDLRFQRSVLQPSTQRGPMASNHTLAATAMHTKQRLDQSEPPVSSLLLPVVQIWHDGTVAAHINASACEIGMAVRRAEDLAV